MFVIRCPYCGDRDMVEFTYGGDASKKHPDNIEEPDQAVWQAHVYERDNPRGWHLEWWQHTSGCRSWVKVARNTLTHEIAGTAAADEPLALPVSEDAS